MWRGLDSTLITSCENGSVYCWNTKTMTKQFEYFPGDKNSVISCLDYDAGLDLLVYATNDKKIFLVNDKGNFEILNYDISPH